MTISAAKRPRIPCVVELSARLRDDPLRKQAAGGNTSINHVDQSVGNLADALEQAIMTHSSRTFGQSHRSETIRALRRQWIFSI